MTYKPTGGPAFPRDEIRQGEIYEQHEGMELRDYFAAKALPGLLAAIMMHEGHNWTPANFANEAYALADAMLAAREA